MIPGASGSPSLNQVLTFLAIAAALPFAAWFLFERFAALVAGLITRLTGRRDPVVSRPRGGGEGMVDEVGVVRRTLAPRGKVFVRGELWDAVVEQDGAGGEATPLSQSAPDPLQPGDRVRVAGVDGLTLRVRPAGPAQDRPQDRELTKPSTTASTPPRAATNASHRESTGASRLEPPGATRHDALLRDSSEIRWRPVSPASISPSSHSSYDPTPL